MKCRFILINFLLLLNSGGSLKNLCETERNLGNEVEIWLTIKAKPKNINNTLRFRLIQINWKVSKIEEGDAIALYEKIPPYERLEDQLEKREGNGSQENLTTSPLYLYEPAQIEGIVTTNITHKRPSLSSLVNGGCVGASAAYLRRGRIIKLTCMVSEPTWIWDNRFVLGETPLPKLILPGTHNSGSYQVEDFVDTLGGWVVCQDESILSQLLLGIRYLDLRVAYYPETEELLWINHDMVRWIPFEKVLADIKTFAFLSPDPVIIDVHRTPVGFENDEAALLLISLLNTTLGEYLAINYQNFNVTAADLWKSGKTLIVSFGSPLLRKEVPWLFPPIYQAWANAQNIEDLQTYLDEEMQKDSNINTLWVAMGHLTPSMWDIIFHADDGIRGWADKTGRNLSDWLKYNWSRSINIITADFFLSSNIIDLSKRLSLKNELCVAFPEENFVGNLKLK